MKRIAILIAVLAILGLAALEKAQGYYRGCTGYNSYTGGRGHTSSAYNPYTGRGETSRSYYNPYTGREHSSETTYNPYTNSYQHSGQTSNAYTGRSTYNYGAYHP
jgi:hypothetical protein